MLKNKETCTGCGACASICPKKCIEMLEDSEGFFYPSINNQVCISCGLCDEICPVKKEVRTDFKTYTVCVQNLDERIREISSAGGAVGAIFNYVFDKNGSIIGAGFDADNQVIHVLANSMNECIERGVFASKYVSSDLRDSFEMVKSLLNEKKIVCFVGLPCQVAGLNAFLEKKYNDLITIDLTCYGVPSRKLYRDYLLFCETYFKSHILKVNFRDKIFGYSAPTMSLEFDNGKKKSQNSVIKSYLRCFFKNISARPACYSCSFKKIERSSDFTIGDCKTIKDYNSNWDDDKGTSVVYIHTHKAQTLLKQLEATGVVRVLSVPLDQILASCGTKMTENIPNNEMRKGFFKDMEKYPYNQLIKKYCPATIDEKCVNIFKGFLMISGLNKTRLLKKLKRR